MLSAFKTHVRSWITGLHARSLCVPPAGACEAGELAYYNERLEQIGNDHNVWRMRNEPDRDLAFRTAVAIAERLNALEDDLTFVINFNKG